MAISHRQRQRLIQERRAIEREVDRVPQELVDDAIEDLGGTRIGRPLDPVDIPALEAAVRKGGASAPGAAGLISQLLERLRGLREIREQLLDQ